MRLRLVVSRRRGRAGLGGLTPARLLAGALLLAAVLMAGCGGSHTRRAGAPTSTPSPARAPRGPSFGLTEDNAQLLSDLASAGSAPGEVELAAARARLAALHPSYVRLLVDWAALQPDPHTLPALEAPVDGCARSVGPCAGYRGIAAELAALAARQRAARAEGRTAYQVVLDVFGTPAWAARAPGGCEPPGGAQPFSRPITDAGLAGYRALIRALLALGAREGVELSWWSPWNEPNNPQFLSPQQATCASSSPSLATAVYSQLAQAMAGELAAGGGTRHLLLGELASYATSSAHGTSVAEFVGELPASVICLSEDWAIHVYASYGTASSTGDPVAALESALDARGACGRDAHVWVTEAGVGAPHPGARRPSSAAAEREGCLALGAQLARWAADPRVEAILQYSFREDPAFPVGLLSADLAHVYPAYRLWLSYTQMRSLGEPPRSPDVACA